MGQKNVRPMPWKLAPRVGLVVLAGSHDGIRANCETVGSETAHRNVKPPKARPKPPNAEMPKLVSHGVSLLGWVQLSTIETPNRNRQAHLIKQSSEA